MVGLMQYFEIDDIWRLRSMGELSYVISGIWDFLRILCIESAQFFSSQWTYLHDTVKQILLSHKSCVRPLFFMVSRKDAKGKHT